MNKEKFMGLKFLSIIKKEDVQKFFKTSGNIVLLVVTGLSAFSMGYYYPKIKASIIEEEIKMGEIKGKEFISTSVTDRGELLILDRNTGRFQIFEEKVGFDIFKAYGQRISNGITPASSNGK